MEGRYQKNPHSAGTIRVCIDSHSAYDIAGRFYSRLNSREITFGSMAEFLLRADRLLDYVGPQSFQRKRIFQDRKRKPGGIREETGKAEQFRMPADETAEFWKQEGKCLTCDVVITARMHTSWQGFVRYGDAGRRIGVFESELQLITILLELAEGIYGMPKEAGVWEHWLSGLSM